LCNHSIVHWLEERWLRVPLSCAFTALSASPSCTCPQKRAYVAGGERGTGVFMAFHQIKHSRSQPESQSKGRNSHQEGVRVLPGRFLLASQPPAGACSAPPPGEGEARGGQVWFLVPHNDISALTGVHGARPPAEARTGSSPSGSPRWYLLSVSAATMGHRSLPDIH